ncbi:MAG: hypothetical protein KAT77_01050 [Nanoarchaeota archaeon]|nr:hypothetical protein [Nanoarchaeota archaeon]
MNNPVLEFEQRLEGLTILDVGLDLLGDQVKKGKYSPDYRGLCPFHQEENPSFYLKVRWNEYVCFGCHKSGIPASLPFDLLGAEKGLSYLEKKLQFDRNNILHMAVLKMHAQNADERRGLFGGFPSLGFLEDFEPFDDPIKSFLFSEGLDLTNLYREVKSGKTDLLQVFQGNYPAKALEGCTEQEARERWNHLVESGKIEDFFRYL